MTLVGSSGSGKSTIAALLQRLYEPNKGVIKIGGKAADEVDVGWLREHVGVVSQEQNLFDGSIADNIWYGASSTYNNAISDMDIWKAAKSAQGYDTRVGENASLISGGQAQRLQIERPWMKVKILDECTSSTWLKFFCSLELSLWLVLNVPP